MLVHPRESTAHGGETPSQRCSKSWSDGDALMENLYQNSVALPWQALVLVPKVLGFVLEKNLVPTELDEFWKNSDEFRTQFGEFSECEA
jgi:hypothetical protein